MRGLTKILLVTTFCAAVGFSNPSMAAPGPAGVSFITSFHVFGTATPNPSGASIGSGANATSVNLTGTGSGGAVIISGLSFSTAAAGANGDVLSFTPPGFTANSPQSLSITWDSKYSFTSITDSFGQSPNSFSHLFSGTFHDTSGSLADQSADFSISFNQTSVNNIAFSGTFDTPNVLPEPASMMILGLGLAGLVAARRRA